MHSKKGFDDELAKTRAQVVEDFKKLDEFGTLLGQYGSDSYNYGLRLARLFLRSKLPKDFKLAVKELKPINELVNELELSMLDVEDEDEEGEDAETSDQGGPANATNLNKAYLSNYSLLLFFWKRNKYIA